MSQKRLWGRWPARFSDKLNGISGLAGLGGAAIGVAGWSVLAGTAAFAMTGLGIAITVGTVALAAVKAIPPRLKSPEDLNGCTVSIGELDQSSTRLPVLSIIGPTQTGKTTLRHRLAFSPAPLTRTQQITAYVTSLPMSPPRYVAVLDGGGERFP